MALQCGAQPRVQLHFSSVPLTPARVLPLCLLQPVLRCTRQRRHSHGRSTQLTAGLRACAAEGYAAQRQPMRGGGCAVT